MPIVFDTELIGCNGDFSDFYEFDLTNTTITITNGDNSLMINNYYRLITDAENQNNPILNINTYINQSLDEEVFARIENQNGCFSIAKIILKIFHNPKISDDEDIYYCLNNSPNTIKYVGA